MADYGRLELSWKDANKMVRKCCFNTLNFRRKILIQRV